jgi:hypothetical protein
MPYGAGYWLLLLAVASCRIADFDDLKHVNLVM